MADSFQCMTKPNTIKKTKNKQKHRESFTIREKKEKKKKSWVRLEFWIAFKHLYNIFYFQIVS